MDAAPTEPTASDGVYPARDQFWIYRATTIAGNPLRPRSRGFLGNRAVCTYAIPADTKGRTFRSTISIDSRDTRLTRSAPGRAR